MDQPGGIFWVASYPKSGNTWVRVFLNNLFVIQTEGLDAAPSDINKLQRIAGWDVGNEQVFEVLKKPVEQASKEDIAFARFKIQEMIANQNPKIQLVKTHNMLGYKDNFPTINMSVTAGGVYVIRNPLDIAVSFANHLNCDYDTAIRIMATPDYQSEFGQKSIGEIYGSWTQNVNSWTKAENEALLVLKYEDLLEDPIKNFGLLADHLRQFPSDAELERAVELSSFEILKEQEREKGFYEKPQSMKEFFRKGKVDQWKNELSTAQVETLRVIHAEEMSKFGYLET